MMKTKTIPVSNNETIGKTVSRAEIRDRDIEEKKVALNLLVPGPEINQANELDPRKIELLAEKIERRSSIIRPVLVREIQQKGRKTYEILSDARMAYALKKLHYKEMNVVILKNHPDFLIETADAKDLIKLGERRCLIKREVTADVEKLILSEEYKKNMLDGEKSKKMGDDIISNGQTNPVTTAPFILNREVYYEVTDGLHRTNIFKDLKFRTCRIVEVYGWNQQDILMQRILAASSARSAMFVRLTTWMQDAYNLTDWSKMGIKLSSILSLAITKSSGRNLGLSKEEAAKAIDWALYLEESFDPTTKMDLTAIRLIIRAVELSFPDIVGSVRYTSGGGHIGDGVFNQAKFFKLIEALPEDHERQKFMLKLIYKHNLNASEVFEVASVLGSLDFKKDARLIRGLTLNPIETMSEIEEQKALSDYEEEEDDSSNNKSLNGRRAKGRKKSKQDKKGISSSEEDVLEDQGGTEKTQIQTLYLSGDSDQSYNRAPLPQEYELRIKALEDALRVSQAVGKSKELSWLVNPDVSDSEKAILTRWYIDAFSEEEISAQFGITEHQVRSLIASAFRKTHLQILDERDTRVARETRRKVNLEIYNSIEGEEVVNTEQKKEKTKTPRVKAPKKRVKVSTSKKRSKSSKTRSKKKK